jgi:hypothetical protein
LCTIYQYLFTLQSNLLLILSHLRNFYHDLAIYISFHIIHIHVSLPFLHPIKQLEAISEFCYSIYYSEASHVIMLLQ